MKTLIARLNLKIFVFTGLVLFLLMSGCTPEGVYTQDIYILQGETGKTVKNYCFYIGVGEAGASQKIFSIPGASYNLMTKNSEFLTPQGLEVKNAQILLTPMTIMWEQDNTTRYTVPGAKLSIIYEVSTTPSFTPGQGEISVKLPYLSTLKAMGTFYVQEDIGAGCVVPPQPRADFGTIKLNNVVAFATAADKEAANTKRDIIGVIVGILGIAVVIAIFVFGGWLKNKSS